MIYFDNNATTRIAPEVRDAMLPFLGSEFGNPSSAYSLARGSKKVIEEARESVADLIGAKNANEVVFTSGGTESDNFAILGALNKDGANQHIVTTEVEHDAVRKLCLRLESAGKEVSWIKVDGEGALDLNALRAALTRETAIVSVMLANNETGVIFPVRQVAELVKEHSNALFHVDGVNAIGKVEIDLSATEIDLFSLSAHKFHGPKGIGALYVRDGVTLQPMLIGGGQENGMRAGTSAAHQIAGLGAAAKYVKDLECQKTMSLLRDQLEDRILRNIPDSYLNGTADRSRRLCNTTNISFANTNGEMILFHLDRLGICVSTGSACNSASHAASHVLQAMDVPYAHSMGSIRFSLGRSNTLEEVDRLLDVLPGIISELRQHR